MTKAELDDLLQRERDENQVLRFEVGRLKRRIEILEAEKASLATHYADLSDTFHKLNWLFQRGRRHALPE